VEISKTPKEIIALNPQGMEFISKNVMSRATLAPALQVQVSEAISTNRQTIDWMNNGCATFVALKAPLLAMT